MKFRIEKKKYRRCHVSTSSAMGLFPASGYITIAAFIHINIHTFNSEIWTN